MDDDGTASVGRPPLSVDLYEVEFLRSLGFTWCDVAVMLDVSRSTLYRRINEAGFPLRGCSNITNGQLDMVVQEIKIAHPADGEVMIGAHLRTRGVHVPRTRLRASIHRNDPHTLHRMSSAIRRRTYHVESPNCVWHIDGNHKLIRWRFVVHGGIDGYSRVIVYLRCSTNNRALTVLSQFQKGVDTFGLPLRVRSDCGGENVDVWHYMHEQYQSDPSCVIVGASTHNERIERLWRDVHRCVLKPFADTFRSMESQGILDPLNEVDVFCLHYCFLPIVNKAIDSFQEAWNNHKVSTEGNATPYQLYIAGMMAANAQPVMPQVSSLFSNTGCTPRPAEQVEVPRARFIPCSGLLQSLERNFNPLAATNYFDLTPYRAVISLVGQHLLSICHSCLQV